MKITEILNEIPNYKEFMTVQELDNSSKKLAEQFSSVELFEIGKSKEGRAINCLKIGNGSQNALFIGCPHPMEPIGSLTIEFLSRFIAEHPEITEKLDYTWYFIKAIDIDGVILNEEWFKERYDPLQHAINFYMPPPHEEVEWTYPIKHKKLNFNEPAPETRVMMNLIDKIKPSFVYNLHNDEFRGVFIYVSKDIKGMCEELIKLVKTEGIPLHEGEPEFPYIKKLYPGIFQHTGIIELYDYIESRGIDDPSQLIKIGANTADYIKSVLGNDFFYLVCELPYITNEAMGNFETSVYNRRDLLIESMNYQKEIYDFLYPIFKKIRNFCNKSSRMFASVSTLINNYKNLHRVELVDARTSPMYEGKATIAEAFDINIRRKFYYLRNFAQVGRLCQEVSKLHPEKSEFKKYQIDIEQWIEEKFNMLLKMTSYAHISLQKLVRIQVGIGLIALKHLSDNFPID